MPIPLSINGVTFNYPVKGNEQWGVEATNWAIAVTTAINTALTPGDIPQPSTGVFILNNNVTPANVSGLLIDPALFRGAIIEYSIYRVKGSTELTETGTMEVSFKTTSNTWGLSREGSAGTDGDEIGVQFTILPSGQVQYTSSDITTSGTYTSLLQYRVRILKNS